jgi:hypothetical protein
MESARNRPRESMNRRPVGCWYSHPMRFEPHGSAASRRYPIESAHRPSKLTTTEAERQPNSMTLGLEGYGYGRLALLFGWPPSRTPCTIRREMRPAGTRRVIVAMESTPNSMGTLVGSLMFVPRGPWVGRTSGLRISYGKPVRTKTPTSFVPKSGSDAESGPRTIKGDIH